MSRLVMKIHDDRDNKDYYLEWSTTIDAPVTWGLSLEAFTDYYREEYGRQGLKRLSEQLPEVHKTGIADGWGDGLASYFSRNRAGDNETSLNKEGILEMYCRNKVQRKFMKP